MYIITLNIHKSSDNQEFLIWFRQQVWVISNRSVQRCITEDFKDYVVGFSRIKEWAYRDHWNMKNMKDYLEPGFRWSILGYCRNMMVKHGGKPPGRAPDFEKGLIVKEASVKCLVYFFSASPKCLRILAILDNAIWKIQKSSTIKSFLSLLKFNPMLNRNLAASLGRSL